MLMEWLIKSVLNLCTRPSLEDRFPGNELHVEEPFVEEPFVEAARHLEISNQCVQGIARQVHRTLLAGNQCRDLSSKLFKTVGNVNQLIYKFEASSTDDFRLALENFHNITEKASLLVKGCSEADWCKASVFQIYNEEAFREILQELGLCYNVIYEQAKNMSLSNGQVLGVEDLRQMQGATFLPASENDVSEDQESMQRRLEDLVKNSRSSDDRILAKYLLRRLMNGRTSRERVIDASVMYDALLLEVTTKELHRTWDRASKGIGKGSGAESIYSTKWHGIPCAKKVFYQQEVNAPFREEAAILASLNHPNIVKFFCCGYESEGDRKCFIAMEILEMSLTELINRQKRAGKPFPIQVALDIILQIARGMLYLHDLGIAHRDLKPQNVVVDRVGYSTFRVKLVDFGMSKTKVQVSQSNTVSKPGCGTTKYRAPEAFPNHPRDAEGKQKVKWFRADVYSFAVTCSAILSLKEPYEKDGTGLALYNQLVRTSRPPLRPELPPHCPKELSDLLDECWATSWGARPKFADICATLEKLKHDLQKGPNVVKQGRQTVDRFLSNSHSYIDDMMARLSNLRIPVKHIAPDANELAPIPSDDEANVSDDEVEPAVYEDSGDKLLDLNWITSRKKEFIVSSVAGENDELTADLKKACEKFCKGINLSVIPSTVERGQAMIDAVDQLRAQFPEYNAMVVHPHHHKEFEEYAHCRIKLRIHTYSVGMVQVYLFKRGEFTLLGDGGFINWSFGGNYERNSNKVTFWDIPSDSGAGTL